MLCGATSLPWTLSGGSISGEQLWFREGQAAWSRATRERGGGGTRMDNLMTQRGV